MSWYLNNALTTMRNEVNARYPTRDKASDGTVGDADHQASSSDHNPDSDGSVDAWDMDVNLFGTLGGIPSSDIEFLKSRFQAHEAAQYWIHNRIICSRSTGWRRENYTGPNPHDKHVHWNTRSEHEDSTKPFGIEEEHMEREEFLGHFRAAMDDGVARDRLERNTVTYPVAGESYNTLSLYLMLKDKVPALKDQLDELQERVDQIAAAAGGSIDVAAVVAALEPIIRDAVADLGEGGAAQVRG